MPARDPIGVRDIPEAQDEYDAYLGKVYVMLMDGHATPPAIAAYLFDIATDHLGLSNFGELADSCKATAELLIRLQPQFDSVIGLTGSQRKGSWLCGFYWGVSAWHGPSSSDRHSPNSWPIVRTDGDAMGEKRS